MYTVARVTKDDAVSELRAFGDRMNAVRPGSFDRLRRAGDGFSVDISFSDRWTDQRSSMREFMSIVAPLLAEAHSAGIQVFFDVAIDSDDLEATVAILQITCHPDFCAELAHHHIVLMLSIYK